jgi:hypothetical protein
MSDHADFNEESRGVLRKATASSKRLIAENHARHAALRHLGRAVRPVFSVQSPQCGTTTTFAAVLEPAGVLAS